MPWHPGSLMECPASAGPSRCSLIAKADRMCYVAAMRWLTLALLVGFWSTPIAAQGSLFDGEWRVIHPCLLTSDECAGRSDVFTLWLWSAGDRICGDHLATGHLGNRVDEGNLVGSPSIIGTAQGAQAKVAFRSAWGATGHAMLALVDGRLVWHITESHQTDQGAGSWFPDDATLERSMGPGPSGLTCTAPPPTR
jgi:hypothetical protein